MLATSFWRSGLLPTKPKPKPNQKQAAAGASSRVFHGLRVFIQREVPFHALYLVLKAGGAEVGWAFPGSPFKQTDKRITHQIVDRPKEQLTLEPGREYVQPQWALDSFNEARNS